MSEYYDIYLDNGLERIDFTSESPIKISIKRNKSKRFIGIYEITEDNKIKLVDYERNGDNIEIITNKLGKYVVSYKEVKSENSNQNSDNNFDISKATKDKRLFYIIGAVTTALIGIFIIIFKKKK